MACEVYLRDQAALSGLPGLRYAQPGCGFPAL